MIEPGSPVDLAFAEAVQSGVFPGAVLLVRDREEVALRAWGNRAIEPEPSAMQVDTVFDLSSLTKPLATGVAIMMLVADGSLRLDDPVAQLFADFAQHDKGTVTFRQLLSHCSGLAAWRPFFREIRDIEQRGEAGFLGSESAKRYVYREICGEQLEAAPGARALYSDLDFMLLGAAIEEISGRSLDRFCRERIFEPLALDSTAFLAIDRSASGPPTGDGIAPTERCPWRGRVLCGEVHDDNAYAMGGVAGHAGLFGSARDLDRLAQRLRHAWRGGDDIVPAVVVREFWKIDGAVADSTWGLAWDTPAPERSRAGSGFSSNTFGHLGFTGTSIWIDLDRDCHVILLTNRVHPSRDNDQIREFRPMIHDCINQELDARR